jgi:hypothetical protein
MAGEEAVGQPADSSEAGHPESSAPFPAQESADPVTNGSGTDGRSQEGGGLAFIGVFYPPRPPRESGEPKRPEPPVAGSPGAEGAE